MYNRKVSDAKYRKANPEKRRAGAAKWQKENPEKYKVIQARFRKANPEKCKAGTAKWVETNLVKFKATAAKWQKANPEKVAIHNSKRRDLRHTNTPISEMLTSTEWLAILAEANGHCHYCGKEAKLTLDHVIPLSKGGKHSKENVVAACLHCNCSKSNRTPQEWTKESVSC